jgi:uncharacterized protein HemX
MEPNQNPVPPVTPSQSDKSVGPAIGVIIIILVVILGSLYFWGQRIENQNALESDGMENTNEAEIEAMREQSSSDDLNSIEADLQTTDTDSLGEEMSSIEAESSGSAQTE